RTREQLEAASARAFVDATLAQMADLGRQTCDQRAMERRVMPGAFARRCSRVPWRSLVLRRRRALPLRGWRLGPRRLAGTAAGRCRRLPCPQFAGLQLELAMQFAPFAHAQEAQEMLLAPLAQLRLGQVLVRLAIGLPQFQDPDELALGIGEQRMRVVGRGALVGGPLTRILDPQERGDRQHLL